MKIAIRIFGAGEQIPRFAGTLELITAGASSSLTPHEMSTEDLKLLWDVEQAINVNVGGRCHIEVTER